MLCAQGVSPAAATIERFRQLGHDLVPGTGVLAACVPGAFGGWLLLLREFGTWRLEDVLEFAIGYAEDGYPVVPGITATIERVESLLREWPASAALYLPAPRPGELFRNPQLAATYRRICHESRGGSREEEIERAHEALLHGLRRGRDRRFQRRERRSPRRRRPGRVARDARGARHLRLRGVHRVQDGAVGPGPCLPAAARAARRLRRRGHEPGRARPHVTECAKLAFADRDALYGDADVPLAHLLSPEYNDERRQLVTGDASYELRPGLGRMPRLVEAEATLGSGEPTLRSDTVHLDVVDRFGNLVSATPSGGWLDGSPTIPALGLPLGTRAQMFWLEEGLPSSLAPRKRPRTTLSPGLALRGGDPVPCLRHAGRRPTGPVVAALLPAPRPLRRDLQAAIDAPEFHTDHFPSSFFPRRAQLGALAVESRLGDDASPSSAPAATTSA